MFLTVFILCCEYSTHVVMSKHAGLSLGRKITPMPFWCHMRFLGIGNTVRIIHGRIIFILVNYQILTLVKNIIILNSLEMTLCSKTYRSLWNKNIPSVGEKLSWFIQHLSGDWTQYSIYIYIYAIIYWKQNMHDYYDSEDFCGFL